MRNLTRTTITAVIALGALALSTPGVSVQPSTTVTVDGVEYPVCELEDCSDQPNQVGVWISPHGGHWLSTGETSALVQR